jgi:hypothetical protein
MSVRQFNKSCPFCKTDTSLDRVEICSWCMTAMIEQQITLAKVRGGGIR